MLKAIDTIYKEHRFRSRTEAKWAVFFTELGLRWDYEPQGYYIPRTGRAYLVDFYLPELDTFFEVKRAATDGGEDWPSEDAKLNLESICEWQSCHGIIALGAPTLEDYQMVHFNPKPFSDSDGMQPIFVGFSTFNGLLALSWMRSAKIAWRRSVPGWDFRTTNENLKLATEKAMYARFEHGESG